MRSHQFLVKCIRARLERERFSGLPLTLLIIIFLTVLFLFFGLVKNLALSQWVTTVDIQVINLILSFRDTNLIQVFVWISLLGKWQIILSAMIVATLIFLFYRGKNSVLALWITVAGSELFNFLLKVLFQRQRPESALYLEHSLSFPSGHATAAVAFYGFIAYILFKSAKQWTTKISVLFFGFTTILAIGFSRLYLGVHFFSDVLGGYLLGLLWLIIGISVLKWLQGARSPTTFRPTRSMKIAAFSLIVIEILFYVNFAWRYHPAPNLAYDQQNEIDTERKSP